MKHSKQKKYTKAIYRIIINLPKLDYSVRPLTLISNVSQITIAKINKQILRKYDVIYVIYVIKTSAELLIYTTVYVCEYSYFSPTNFPFDCFVILFNKTSNFIIMN